MELLYSIVQNPIVLITILVINTLLMILFLISTLIAGKGYKELNKRYLSFMSKLSNGENVEGMMQEYLNVVNDIAKKSKNNETEIKNIKEQLKKCVQKVGLIRYNAYNDTGSDLSFTLALMDQEENGVVVNGLYSRESSSIFAKPLANGETKYNLSAEEIQAIDIAKASSLKGD
ncbi:MAG: DUF4446 family protein [Clostridia bacterium]|nr:DUF4446 family protein [Clostridia bacterium]